MSRQVATTSERVDLVLQVEDQIVIIDCADDVEAAATLAAWAEDSTMLWCTGCQTPVVSGFLVRACTSCGGMALASTRDDG